MTQETWEQWKPLPNIVGRYYVAHIVDGASGLLVSLSPSDVTSDCVELNFAYAAEAYRWTEETYRTALFERLTKEYDPGFYGNWTCFKVHNSVYQSWMREESHGVSDSTELQHYAFITDDGIFEVLSVQSPEIMI